MNNNQVSDVKKDDVSQWVTFTLDQEIYGIRVLKVQEIQRYCEISSIPGASPHVLGIINLRGNVIPEQSLVYLLLRLPTIAVLLFLKPIKVSLGFWLMALMR